MGGVDFDTYQLTDLRSFQIDIRLFSAKGKGPVGELHVRIVRATLLSRPKLIKRVAN